MVIYLIIYRYWLLQVKLRKSLAMSLLNFLQVEYQIRLCPQHAQGRKYFQNLFHINIRSHIRIGYFECSVHILRGPCLLTCEAKIDTNHTRKKPDLNISRLSAIYLDKFSVLFRLCSSTSSLYTLESGIDVRTHWNKCRPTPS